MRFPSGTTDQYLPFIAVDETDGVTPLSGLSSWTVYRSRNGAAAVAYTTPTITERRPGLYWLLLDEDMTIDDGDDEQACAVEIRHTGMQTAFGGYELYRVKITAGQTLDNTLINASISSRSSHSVSDIRADLERSGGMAHTTQGYASNAATNSGVSSSNSTTLVGKLPTDGQNMAGATDLAAKASQTSVDAIPTADANATAVLAKSTTGSPSNNTVHQVFQWMKATMSSSGVFTDAALEEAPSGGGGGGTVTADRVPKQLTFYVGSEGNKARNIVTINKWSDGTRTLAFDLSELLNQSETRVADLDAVTITQGETEITTHNPREHQEGKIVLWDVDPIEEAGDYNVTVTVETVDSNTIVLTGMLRVE